MLAPWQRIDAVKTFVYPALNFSMRCGVLTKTDWRRLDDAVRPLVKRTLYLPGNASTHYIYGSAASGAAAILVAAELHDICRVADAYAVASARLGWEATRSELEAYLSGEIEGAFRTPATQLRSVWAEARKASRRLHVAWTIAPDGATLTCADVTILSTHRCRVMRSVREVLAPDRDRALQAQPNQGKERDQRCRTCGYQRQTLPHVLCHCMARSVMYTARHNAVVARLRKAASRDYTIAFENRPVGDTGLRPDLVRGEEAIILDDACPFENTPEAFSNTRNDKVAKYEPVAAYIRRRYQRVTVAAVTVGALGAWDPANDRVLQRLCSRAYLRLLKKICISDVVAASRRVYHEHVRAGRP
ncbi:hypothetical protein MTO96_025981 [Rhipicephalus appendiculatus]